MGILHLVDIHHPLEAQFVEIEPVADIVVGRYRLGVVIDHDAPPTALADGIEGIDAAPVELHAAADAVGTAAQHYHALAVVGEVDIVLGAVVGQIQIVGLCGEFRRQGIDLLDTGDDTQLFAPIAHLVLLHLDVINILVEGAGYLMVRETLAFGQFQQLERHLFHLGIPL